MAATVTTVDRIFKFNNKGEDIVLPDPNPNFTAASVLNFYSNSYPSLTTAKIEGPEFKDGNMTYNFKSVMGTKG